MSQLVTFTDLSLGSTFARWAQLRRSHGKDLQGTLRKVMKFWLDFAWSRIDPGDKPKIMADLTRVISTANRPRSRPRGKRAQANEDKYWGTVAAAIVKKINYKGANSMKRPAFYAVVGRFVRARVRSANLHRSGMLPGYALVKAKAKGPAPKWRHAPGEAAEKMLSDAAEILVRNFASSKGGDGIASLFGNAFEGSMADIQRLIEKFAAEDEVRYARQAGMVVIT